MSGIDNPSVHRSSNVTCRVVGSHRLILESYKFIMKISTNGELNTRAGFGRATSTTMRAFSRAVVSKETLLMSKPKVRCVNLCAFCENSVSHRQYLHSNRRNKIINMHKRL